MTVAISQDVPEGRAVVHSLGHDREQEAPHVCDCSQEFTHLVEPTGGFDHAEDSCICWDVPEQLIWTFYVPEELLDHGVECPEVPYVP